MNGRQLQRVRLHLALRMRPTAGVRAEPAGSYQIFNFVADPVLCGHPRPTREFPFRFRRQSLAGAVQERDRLTGPDMHLARPYVV